MPIPSRSFATLGTTPLAVESHIPLRRLLSPHRTCVAVAGSHEVSPHRCTQSGLHGLLSRLGSRAPVTVVSGLDAGSATWGHRWALSQRLPSIAVLSTGLDRTHPSGSWNLRGSIIAGGGAVLSPFPHDKAYNHTHRNVRDGLIADMTTAMCVAPRGAAAPDTDPQWQATALTFARGTSPSSERTLYVHRSVASDPWVAEAARSCTVSIY